jgi:hypothetical protein
MLLTIVSSIVRTILSHSLPGRRGWAVSLAGRIRFEDFILHEMLGLMLLRAKSGQTQQR